MKSAVIYASPESRVNSYQQAVYGSKSGKRYRIYVRVDIVDGYPGDALNAAKPRNGEVLLNSLSLEGETP